MKSCVNGCCVAGILAVMLFLPGCKKASSNANSANNNNNSQPSGGGVSLQPSSGGGGGVMSTLPAVQRTVSLNDLKQFGQLYTQYALTNGMPPANLEALGLDKDAPNLYKTIKDGDVIVFWGVDGSKTPEGPANTVLAYPKNAEKPGAFAIPVALCDGTARNMTPPEFAKAPKAGK
jgi:hypothetical protein